MVKRPATAVTFFAQLQRFSGKGRRPLLFLLRATSGSPPKITKRHGLRNCPESSQTASGADNTVNNNPIMPRLDYGGPATKWQ